MIGFLMSKQDKRRLYEAIREILFSEWDPIGINSFAPDDEYDSYVPTILRLLEHGRDERRIADQLRRFAEENIGLTSVDPVHCRKVAQMLCGLVESDRGQESHP